MNEIPCRRLQPVPASARFTEHWGEATTHGQKGSVEIWPDLRLKINRKIINSIELLGRIIEKFADRVKRKSGNFRSRSFSGSFVSRRKNSIDPTEPFFLAAQKPRIPYSSLAEVAGRTVALTWAPIKMPDRKIDRAMNPPR